MQELHNKVAVVTGAASGIGLGITRALIAEGVNVAMLDIEENALNAAHATLNEANVDVQRYVCDVSSRHNTSDTADAVKAHFGRVDIVCNNAGVVSGGPMGELTYDDWDWVMGVNFNGVVNGMQTYVPIIKAGGEGGHIVNTASILGHVTGARQSIYAASKYAVVGLSEATRADLAPFGIGVSALCPGMIATKIIESDRNRPGEFADTSASFVDGDRDTVSETFQTQGLNPDKVGEQVVHGIKNDKPFIFTHAGLKDAIDARFQTILASFDGSEVDDGDFTVTQEP